MTKMADARWDERLNAWAEYIRSAERGGKIKISAAYSMVGRGSPAEGDGIPIHVGEALDTNDLVKKLPEYLRRAVWMWYCEQGTQGDKAAALSIARTTLIDRVNGAKRKLQAMHSARLHPKTKSAGHVRQKA
jgi:DNA-directed RNA polymerase specialized sigma24 family protein